MLDRILLNAWEVKVIFQTSSTPAGTAYGYYALHYRVARPSGFDGPIRVERYVTLSEAVRRAHEMLLGGQLNPLEIRDPNEKLITSSQMGWQT